MDTLLQPPPPSSPETPGRRWSPRRVRLAGYLLGVLLAAALVASGLWLARGWLGNPAQGQAGQGANSNSSKAWERTIVTESGLESQVGVRIAQLAVTGDGGLIDLRYQVIDPDKAAAVHNPATPPVIVDDRTGVVVNSLLMGHAHTGVFTAGQTYYLIFENPGNLVQSGTTVSVLLGNAEVDHMTVR